MTLLALDVGNTRLKWAFYDEHNSQYTLVSQGAEFLDNIDKLAEGAWSDLSEPEKIIGCVVAGDAVRRRINSQLEIWQATPRWIVASASALGLVNGYDHPSRLGADRWAAMIGARSKLSAKQQLSGHPLIVVMVGTAVTVDAIDDEGKFLGGYILPGHGIMLKALFSGTAGLHVPTGEVCQFPTNTSDALTSGGTFAIAGAIERMIRHLNERTGTRPICFMTGGAAWKMAPSLGFEVEIVETLIFDGLVELSGGL